MTQIMKFLEVFWTEISVKSLCFSSLWLKNSKILIQSDLCNYRIAVLLIKNDLKCWIKALLTKIISFLVEHKKKGFTIQKCFLTSIFDPLWSQAGSAHQLEFDNLLLIIHYYALRAAMKTLNGLGKSKDIFPWDFSV